MKIHISARKEMAPAAWGSVEEAALLATIKLIHDEGYHLESEPESADILHLWRPCGCRKKAEELVERFAGKKKIIIEAFGSHVLTAWDLHNTDRILRKEEVKDYDKYVAEQQELLLLNGCDLFRVPSVFSKQTYFLNPAAEDAKIVVRPFGFNENFFYYSTDKRAEIRNTWCKSLGLSPNIFIVGFFGRLRYRRGFHNFVDMVEQISHKYPDMLFIAMGEDKDALEYVNNKLLSSGTLYVGKPDTVTDMANYMNLADIVVTPAIESGFSLTTLEAMACGCYPIVSSNAGISYILIEGATGNIFSPYNINLLMQNVVSSYNTWKNNPEIFRKIQSKAAHIAQYFTWHRYMRELLHDYKTVMENNNV